MENMNPIFLEIMAFRNLETIQAETRPICLEKKTLQFQLVHNRWTANRMVRLAEWMISTGESLRRRYDHAAMRTYHAETVALAQ